MGKINKGMFTSDRGDWETPPKFFAKLDAEFHFTLDVCASKHNAKCKRYFTKEQNSLTKDWQKAARGGACFMNPPYGDEIPAWVKKAAESGALVVGLLPARTDTRWFHDHVYGKAELRFVKGRIHFVGGKYGAPFPSVIAIWRPRQRCPNFGTCELDFGKCTRHKDKDCNL